MTTKDNPPRRTNSLLHSESGDCYEAVFTMPDGRPIDNPELRPPKNAIPQRMLEQAYVTLTGLPPPYHIASATTHRPEVCDWNNLPVGDFDPRALTANVTISAASSSFPVAKRSAVPTAPAQISRPTTAERGLPSIPEEGGQQGTIVSSSRPRARPLPPIPIDQTGNHVSRQSSANTLATPMARPQTSQGDSKTSLYTIPLALVPMALDSGEVSPAHTSGDISLRPIPTKPQPMRSLFSALYRLGQNKYEMNSEGKWTTCPGTYPSCAVCGTDRSLAPLPRDNCKKCHKWTNTIPRWIAGRIPCTDWELNSGADIGCASCYFPRAVLGGPLGNEWKGYCFGCDKTRKFIQVAQMGHQLERGRYCCANKTCRLDRQEGDVSRCGACGSHAGVTRVDNVSLDKIPRRSRKFWKKW